MYLQLGILAIDILPRNTKRAGDGTEFIAAKRLSDRGDEVQGFGVTGGGASIGFLIRHFAMKHARVHLKGTENETIFTEPSSR